MPYLSSYDTETVKNNIERLNNLSESSTAKWGTMNAAQMLAHLNVAYDITFERKEVNINGVMRWAMTKFLKPLVVGDKPYKRNSGTAPFFKIQDNKNFEEEKALLTENMKNVEQKGASYFEGRKYPSFNNMTADDFSNLFQKHIEHHFEQFGI